MPDADVFIILSPDGMGFYMCPGHIPILSCPDQVRIPDRNEVLKELSIPPYPVYF